MKFSFLFDGYDGRYLGCGPLTVTVTTRIITFSVGRPYKPSFTTVTGRGPHSIDTFLFDIICVSNHERLTDV